METKDFDTSSLQNVLAVLRAQSPDNLARKVAQLLKTHTQWDLFTILRCDHANEQTERIYTSHADQHPTGGRKPFNPLVLNMAFVQGEKIHLCRSSNEVALSYANDTLAHKYSGAMNIPVVWNNELMGMLNLLREGQPFRRLDEDLMIAMAALSRPLFLRQSGSA